MSISSSTLIDALAESGVSGKELERRLAEFALGIACALEAAEISVEQAESDLFNLEIYNAAKKKRLSKELVEMLEWGMELADVAAIASKAMPESLLKIRQLAKEIIAKSCPSPLTPRL